MAKRKAKALRKDVKYDRKRPRLQFTGANSEPVVNRLARRTPDDREGDTGPLVCQPRNFLAKPKSKDDPLPKKHPSSPPALPGTSSRSLPSEPGIGQAFRNSDHVTTVTNGFDSQEKVTMNTNGHHSLSRQQQSYQQRDKRNHVNDIAPPSPSSGIVRAPTRSHIQVAKPYVFHQAIEGCFNELGVSQNREDNIRLAGVQWIDSTRKALKLYATTFAAIIESATGRSFGARHDMIRPVRTFDTAVIYYHKFRLSHADNEYSFVDAAAGALFAACKIEDTLKKSRDILCAAHNFKVGSRADHLSSDDPIFEHPSRTIIGLERLMLEASSFDFRNRHPQPLIVKLAKHHGHERHSAVTKTAYQISIDMYRTFAPLKQSTPAMAFACLELAGRLHGQENRPIVEGKDYKRWGIERAMVMETLLDLLELYTHYQTSTTVGPEFAIEAFLNIRIVLNEELSAKRIPRFTEYVDMKHLGKRADPAGYAVSATNGVLPPPNGPNGRIKASPTSPATPGTPSLRQKAGERGKEGTVRFMLNPDREREEKSVIAAYGSSTAAARR